MENADFILLAALLIFVAGILIYMTIKYHKFWDEYVLADFEMTGYHDMGASYLESNSIMAPNQLGICEGDWDQVDDIILSGDVCKQIGISLGDRETVRVLIIRNLKKDNEDIFAYIES